MVQLSNEDFVKMTERIKYLEVLVEELEKANKFLNNQIKDYNAKFAKDSK